MATEHNQPTCPLPTHSKSYREYDAEAGHLVKDIQPSPNPTRSSRRSLLAIPVSAWCYISITILDIVILIMVSVVIHGLSVESDIYDQYGFDPVVGYTTFGPTKFLLFVSIWTMFPILFYIFCSQPIFGHEAPQSPWCEWTRFFEWSRFPREFVNTFIAHFTTWVFWFAGALAQTAWLDQGYWCRGSVCKYLLPSSVTYDGFVAAFAYLQVLLWSYRTFMVLKNFIQLLT